MARPEPNLRSAARTPGIHGGLGRRRGRVPRIIERIERDLGLPGLAGTLAERLGPSALQSLLMEVQRLHALARNAPSILSQYTGSRFVRIADCSPRELAEWDRVAFSCLPDGFESVELSPVCPLGTCAVVGGVAPTWSVATGRNT